MMRYCSAYSIRLALLACITIAVGCSPAAMSGQKNVPSTTDSAKARDRHEPATEVEMRIVTSKQLEEAIQSRKGKIVVVDFWATWCDTCMKEFPRLVALHQKFEKDGVVCVSVSVDEKTDKEAALSFLRERKAAFPNFLLDEQFSAWQERWSIKGIPVVLVYGRDGKLAKKFDNDDPDNQFTYADVNKLVEQLSKANQ